ncbi:tRNA adenosine(34) deaminase TadA [Pajaroellobacter abortibovis]|uniref:tRNA-specific adenosine deaminase n=1 Tax=Pajaroellobacter abortibovis TaxID=1882918 RepID=A0A1L6MZX6_9BACT|nr:tRNA adenosine(34) deaminase TadA [Pajaroellobacter abortibovis]APS00958.1 hypothetical protein BCY86_07610 [Pajaroellobacter abortibovis]
MHASHPPNPKSLIESCRCLNDEQWMRKALREADTAAQKQEVPIGCVLVDSNHQLLAKGHNLRETQQDPTAHAEIIALRAASKRIHSWRLEGVTAYVTLEPCPMCAGALSQARVKRVVFGCTDPKAGALSSLFRIGDDERLNYRLLITQGILEKECAQRLQAFFAALRLERKNYSISKSLSFESS